MSRAYAETVAETSEAQQAGNIRFPRKNYLLRCVECTYGRSKVKEVDGKTVGNNPMLTRVWEVVSPETVRIDDKEYIIAGKQITDYLTMTGKNAKNVVADSERLGVPVPDDEEPNTEVYLGKEARALIFSEGQKWTDEETGEPIKDSKGDEVTSFRYSIRWL